MHMEYLKIDWETGCMELNVKMFFPCNMKDAMKIVPLINRYCTEEDRAALLLELRGMAEDYRTEMQRYKAAIAEFERDYAALGFMTKTDSEAEKRCKIESRKAETLLKRTEKIINLIEGRKP